MFLPWKIIISDFYLNRMDTQVSKELIESRQDKPIAIIGSGPSGITLAFLMAKKGLSGDDL